MKYFYGRVKTVGGGESAAFCGSGYHLDYNMAGNHGLSKSDYLPPNWW